MQKFLVVVDMQKDFIDGALGTKEAQAILPRVAEYVKGFEGRVVYTRDTHGEHYPDTREGKRLPVPHCIRGTEGWQIAPELDTAIAANIIDKPCFGSLELASYLVMENEKEPIESVTFVGVCTDICVISNAMIVKSALPEIDVAVVAELCAGVTPESHENALAAMKMCQMDIV